MIRPRSSPIAALAALLVFALPQTSGGVELDRVSAGSCRGVTCETIHAGSGAALFEIRGSAPADAKRMLDLTVYNAATDEIVYYDTVEAPAGDFTFHIALRGLRPGSYAFHVGRRYSGTINAAGTLTWAPGMIPAVPAWPPYVAEEYHR